MLKRGSTVQYEDGAGFSKIWGEYEKRLEPILPTLLASQKK